METQKLVPQPQLVVLVGGRSTEHDASVLSYLALRADFERRGRASELRHVCVADRHGAWRLHTYPQLPATRDDLERTGRPLSWMRLISLLRRPESFALNLLHGNEGEDGGWQGIADVADLRGSFGGVLPAALTMHKWAQSLVAIGACPGLCMPATWRVRAGFSLAELQQITAEVGEHPVVVKPNAMGASHLTELQAQPTLDWLAHQCRHIHRYDALALVQRYVPGREFTCGVVEREGTAVALPVIEAVTERHFLGHDEKHRGLARAVLEREGDAVSKRIQAVSTALFEAFELQGMCRFDFILAPAQAGPAPQLYFLEANSIPGLMPGSAFPQMLAAVGADRSDLVDLLLAAAQRRSRREKVLRYSIGAEH